jgi:hypothetical protein
MNKNSPIKNMGYEKETDITVRIDYDIFDYVYQKCDCNFDKTEMFINDIVRKELNLSQPV